jgi:prepilin-type N-terminal cleavage/methylation domain-containing protein
MKNTFRRRGFTLIELLVTISIIAILASLLLPALARAKAAGKRAVCTSNVRQLAVAMQMYLHDYDDYFPTANEVGDFQEEEWLRWNPIRTYQPGSFKLPDTMNLLKTGIVPYVTRFSTNLFDCPADAKLPRYRRKPSSFSQFVQEWQDYHFSYTLNTPYFAAAFLADRYSWRHGMASTPYNASDNRRMGFIHKVRASSINAPSQKIMFADERMLYELKPEPATIGYRRQKSAGWNWPFDEITSRHNQRGIIAGLDGHVEAIRPEVAKQPERFDPLY